MTPKQTAAHLLSEHCPKLAGQPLDIFPSGGTDNHIIRIGDDHCLRLPRSQSAAVMLDKELACLPHLASLPTQTPSPCFAGAPNETFEWSWAVYDWLPGESLASSGSAEPANLAQDLAALVTALQKLPPGPVPPAGAHNHYRGAPLALRNTSCRKALVDLSDEYPLHMLSAMWEAAINAAAHSGEHVLIHGDLHPGNLLALGDRLTGVIDWGLMATGDPAVDLMAAWTVCDETAREELLAVLSPDDDLYNRARGWALSFAAIALAYYRNGRNDTLSALSRRTLDQIVGAS